LQLKKMAENFGIDKNGGKKFSDIVDWRKRWKTGGEWEWKYKMVGVFRYQAGK
jgi:hypothetical protein